MWPRRTARTPEVRYEGARGLPHRSTRRLSRPDSPSRPHATPTLPTGTDASLIGSRPGPRRSQEPNLFPRLRLHFADFPYLHAIAPSTRGYSLRRPVAVISYGQKALKGIVPNRTFKLPEPCPLFAGNGPKIGPLCRDGRLLHGFCAKWAGPPEWSRPTSSKPEPPSSSSRAR